MTTAIHKLDAYNSARASDNPLHKDDAAKKLGYAAGMVPGVDMYAYLTYAPVQRWGIEWLQSGGATVNLLKPVYEGDPCEVVITAETGQRLEADLCSGGAVKAKAVFKKGGGESARDALPEVPPRREIANPRVPADEASLTPGTPLGTIRKTLTRTDSPGFLADMRDDLPLYAEQGLVHPGYLLRMCNWAFSQNIALGPWIHTESHVQHFAPAHLDQAIEARPIVRANYEKRGHQWIEADVVLTDESGTLLTLVRHIAIYRLRTAAATP
jgi:hypothetical protein